MFSGLHLHLCLFSGKTKAMKNPSKQSRKQADQQEDKQAEQRYLQMYKQMNKQKKKKQQKKASKQACKQIQAMLRGESRQSSDSKQPLTCKAQCSIILPILSSRLKQKPVRQLARKLKSKVTCIGNQNLDHGSRCHE